MNNSSMFTADRMTHLKIVVVALVCATMVAGVGIAARVTDGAMTSQWAASHRDQGDRAGHRRRPTATRFADPTTEFRLKLVISGRPRHSGAGLFHVGA